MIILHREIKMKPFNKKPTRHKRSKSLSYLQPVSKKKKKRYHDEQQRSLLVVNSELPQEKNSTNSGQESDG